MGAPRQTEKLNHPLFPFVFIILSLIYRISQLTAGKGLWYQVHQVENAAR